MELNRDCLVSTLQGILCHDRNIVSTHVSALRNIYTHVLDSDPFGLLYVSYVPKLRQLPVATQFDGAIGFDLFPDLFDALRG